MYKITNMILTFEPIHHKYNDGKGISVSTLLGNYKEDFDDDFWLRWKAWEYILYPGDNKDVAKEKFRALRKDLKYTYDMMQNRSDILFARLAKTYPKLVQMVEEDIKDSIREQWNKKNENSKVKGSAYHDYNERESLLRGYEINPFDRKSYQVIKPYIWKDGIKTQIVDLHNLEEGYYPELILNMRDIFGQSDRVWINSKKQAYIRDYKTSEQIRTENKFQKMKAPLAHLDDCELSHYTIQLSLYAYILEDKGYEIMELGIDHFNTEITVPYLKKEVENIILDYEMSTI